MSSQDEMLCNAGARIGIENFAGKVHHKFAVIDVEGDDPLVILGSYNWTASGAYDNDENTLIIHDRDLAQAYYAEWQRLWSALELDRICNPFGVCLPVILRDWTPMPTPTPTVFVYCTPPPCDFDAGEVYYCPSECPGGCGTECATVTPAPSPADVQITHIEYDPPGDDVQGEYVQIENQGGSAADMTGWTLRDEADYTYTFPTFALNAGATVRVWTKSGINTVVDLYWGSGSAIWNNDGDTAYLRDDQGSLVDTYSY